MQAMPNYLPVLRTVVAAAVAFSPVAVVAESPSVATAKSAPSKAVAEKPHAVDVALHPDGLLIGQVVAASGKPTAGATVRVTLSDGSEAEAKTNAEGGFAFKDVRGVAYLQCDQSQMLARTWAPGTAPPNASPAVLMVQSTEVARGQHYAGMGAQTFVGRSKRLLANPLFVAGVVGTAVAIPVAIHNSDDDDPAS